MAGRPKFIIDYKLVESLGKIMCTEKEIASVLNCSVKTLQNDEEFIRVYNNAKDSGKMSLRRKQWKLADTNTSMAIFLGKQYLGQRDNIPDSKDEELSKLDELLEGMKNDANKVE